MHTTGSDDQFWAECEERREEDGRAMAREWGNRFPEIVKFRRLERLRNGAAAWAGMMRGEAFRRAELQDEEDRDVADRSPCGIHLYPRATDACPACGMARDRADVRAAQERIERERPEGSISGATASMDWSGW